VRVILAGVPFNSHPSTWIEVDTGALAGNLRALRRLAGVRVMAVVKANAYGHGLTLVGRAIEQAGVDWIGVARMEEGLELRRAGVSSPVLVLGLTPPAQMAQAVGSGLALTVWSAEQIEWAASASSVDAPTRLHLKIDTGMGRIGAPPAQAVELARAIAGRPSLSLEAVYTHFACADLPDPASTQDQARTFHAVLEAVRSAGVAPAMVHAANSAASLAHPATRHDMVRVGVALYGLHPSAAVRLPQGFHPALSWKSQLSMVKTVPAGRGLSYGHAYVTSRREKIATIPVGYGDGFRRTDGNEVLVGGRRVPVVGRVCMDQILVRLDDDQPASPGDEVVLIGSQGSNGSQGSQRITAEDLAERWGTINYEVVCGLSARVPRVET
jgi:alanine racemase